MRTTTTNLSIRMNVETKKEAEAMFDSPGMRNELHSLCALFYAIIQRLASYRNTRCNRAEKQRISQPTFAKTLTKNWGENLKKSRFAASFTKYLDIFSHI